MMPDEQNHRHDLINHPSLQVLMPHLKSYASKGLAELRAGGKTFPGTASEIYAAYVVERVSELDNSLAALRLALGFIMDLRARPRPDPDVYRYHYENFVLRIIGIVDRTHRLVGAALLMDRIKLESTRGNNLVQKRVKIEYPEIYSVLQRITQAVEGYRGPRNELIHNAAFSSRELGLFQSIRQFGIDMEGVDIDELAREHFCDGQNEIVRIIAYLVEVLNNLLTVLHPLFLIAAKHRDEGPSSVPTAMAT